MGECLEEDVAGCGCYCSRVALDFLVVVRLAMKLEAGNLLSVEGGDVAVGL